MKRLVLALCILLFAYPAIAADVSFSWLPPVEGEHVTGYTIYFGTSSGNYTGSVDVGLPTVIDGRLAATVSGVSTGALLYYAATAYNEDAESDYSDEVVYRAAWGKPGKPQSFNWKSWER